MDYWTDYLANNEVDHPANDDSLADETDYLAIDVSGQHE